mmetsp:Transcript_26744/g.4793  ORF Transcript_26744/g.4793 Transcript_26744/m.4793 type:complete len:93 (-) Transcript_26744:646-924(-)
MTRKDESFTLSVFDAVGRILDSTQFKKLKQKEKIDLFFIDSSLIGLMIQENYLYAFQSSKKVVHDMSKAADSIAFGDILDTRIRRNRQWGLL